MQMEAQARPDSAESSISASSAASSSQCDDSSSSELSSLASSQLVSAHAAVPNRAVLPPDIHLYMHEMQDRFRAMPRSPVRNPRLSLRPSLKHALVSQLSTSSSLPQPHSPPLLSALLVLR